MVSFIVQLAGVALHVEGVVPFVVVASTHLDAATGTVTVVVPVVVPVVVVPPVLPVTIVVVPAVVPVVVVIVAPVDGTPLGLASAVV